MKKVLISLGILLNIVSYGQKGTQSIHHQLQLQTDKIFEELISIQRDIHMNPELAQEEKRTSQIITNYLESLGLEVKTNIGGHGVVGILKTGRKGKKIAWRADIDALETEHIENSEYKSKIDGVRHICGHDIHTVIGLGIANVLSSLKNQLSGTIYFIFQPAEENYSGARLMIEDGLFELIDPDEIYGLHVAPMPVGMAAVKSNELFAYLKVIKLKFNYHTDSENASSYFKSVLSKLDTESSSITYENYNDKETLITYSKHLISQLTNQEPKSHFWTGDLADLEYGIMSQQSVYKDYLVAHQTFKITDSNQQISIEAVLEGSSKEYFDHLIAEIKSQINQSKYANHLVSVDYSWEKPNVINSENLASQSSADIIKVYGDKSIIPIYGIIPTRNDDFSQYLDHVPGVYYLIGGSNIEKGIISMPHASNFMVDEECIRVGVNYFSSMICERVNIQ